MDDPSQLFNKKDSENNNALDDNTDLAPFKGKTITRPILLEDSEAVTKIDIPKGKKSGSDERNTEKKKPF